MNRPINATDPSGHCYKTVNGQLAPECQNRWKEYDTAIKEQTEIQNPQSNTANEYYWRTAPSSTPSPPPAYVPGPTRTPTAQPANPAESDQWQEFENFFTNLRRLTDLTDPVMLGETTGTSKDYLGAADQALIIINNTIAPGNPISKIAKVVFPIVPLISTGYNVIYDQITQTGPYASIDLPPRTKVYIVIAVVTTVVPVFLVPK